MKVEYHRRIQQELNEAAAYYDERGIHLAARLRAKFSAGIEAIKVNPSRFPFHLKNPTMRRVRLKHFPYLIIYRQTEGGVRVLVFKNEHRHPGYGMTRW